MADLEGGNYYGMESQAVAGGRWSKVVGTTLAGSCLVLLWVTATSALSPGEESTNLFSVVNSKNTAISHLHRLQLTHQPWASNVPKVRNVPDASAVLKTHGIGRIPEGELPMSATRANYHDFGDGYTYAINPNSRLGKLAREAQEREERERIDAAIDAAIVAAADHQDEMPKMNDETGAKVSGVRRGVLSQARNMAGFIALMNFFDRLGSNTDAST